MLKKYIFAVGFLSLLFWGQCLRAQVDGRIVDEGGQPVPYVNIWSTESNTGTTSKKDGFFTLNVKAGQPLSFSAVGYQGQILSAAPAMQVRLQTAVIALDEVVVQAPKATQLLTLGSSNKKEVDLYYACWSQPWIVAQYFPGDSVASTPFLRKVALVTKSSRAKTRFNLRILQANADGSPGAPLYSQNLITQVRRGTEVTEIDLSQLRLRMPENGLFIGFEFLIVEENKQTMQVKGQKEDMVTYEPAIGAVPAQAVSAWRYVMGRWGRIEPPSSAQWNGQRRSPSALAIALTLTN